MFWADPAKSAGLSHEQVVWVRLVVQVMQIVHKRLFPAGSVFVVCCDEFVGVVSFVGNIEWVFKILVIGTY